VTKSKNIGTISIVAIGRCANKYNVFIGLLNTYVGFLALV
jgi:hypothetical protein